MGATRSQPNLSGRVAPRHPPRLGDWQVRPDGTALQFVQEADDDGRAVKHFRCVDTLGLLLKGGSISAAQYDAGQLRGVSRFSPALVKLFLLDQYDDAELDRKKVAAMFVGFVRRPERELDNTADRDDQGEPLLPLEPGQLQMLDDGEDITFSAPADVGGNYESFQYRTLLQVAAALGLPYANLTADMLKANYSNTRAALLEFRRRIESFQHSVIVYQMCRAVWARWMDMAVLSGQLALPDYEQRRADYLDCSWLPPRWDWVDPLKDIRAETLAIQSGFKSRTQAIGERGIDAAMVDAEIASDRDREARLGLAFTRGVPPATPLH